MAQKTCPNCKTKCGPRSRTCPNTNCKYNFLSKDEPGDIDEEDEVEEDSTQRNCQICDSVFYPQTIKKSATGQLLYVWHYDIYCSSTCVEQAEEIFFNFIFSLKNLPDNIKKLVNQETFNYRNNADNINYASFIQLITPRKSISKVEWEEKMGRSAPPRKDAIPEKTQNQDREEEPEELKEDLNNLSLDDFLDVALDNPKSKLLTPVEAEPKLDRYHKQCPGCGQIMGKKKYVCDKCGHKFKSE